MMRRVGAVKNNLVGGGGERKNIIYTVHSSMVIHKTLTLKSNVHSLILFDSFIYLVWVSTGNINFE